MGVALISRHMSDESCGQTPSTYGPPINSKYHRARAMESCSATLHATCRKALEASLERNARYAFLPLCSTNYPHTVGALPKIKVQP